MRSALVLLLLAGCDPIWGVHVKLRDPANHPLDTATVALACPDGTIRASQLAVRTTATGEAHLGGMGTMFPVGCDVFIAKPGFRTHVIRYHDLCPDGPDHCDRVFAFDLVLGPE